MTHLILKDMIKVKGQVSEMATLLIDPEEEIVSLARSFFAELATKVRPRGAIPFGSFSHFLFIFLCHISDCGETPKTVYKKGSRKNTIVIVLILVT